MFRTSKLIWNSIISILDNEIQENNEFDEINFSQKENKIEIIKKIEEKGKMCVVIKLFIIN